MGWWFLLASLVAISRCESTWKWGNGPSNVDPFWLSTGVVSSDRAYYYGGTTDTTYPYHTTLPTFRSLQFPLYKWNVTEKPTMSRFLHSTALVNKKIYLTGGLNPDPLGDTKIFNLETGEWDASTPSIPPRWGHSAVFASDVGTLVLFGGRTGDGVITDSLYVYNIQTSMWSAPLVDGTAAPRAGHAAVYASTHHRMLVVGGESTGALNPNELLVLETWAVPLRWTTLTTTGPSPSLPRIHPAVTLIPGTSSLVVIGGINPTTGATINDIHVLSLATQAWWQPTARNTAGISPVLALAGSVLVPVIERNGLLLLGGLLATAQQSGSNPEVMSTGADMTLGVQAVTSTVTNTSLVLYWGLLGSHPWNMPGFRMSMHQRMFVPPWGNIGYFPPFPDNTATCPGIPVCLGHGTCSGQTCLCDPGWAGTDCGTATCPGLPVCSGRGTCHGTTCACDSGWTGPMCDRSNKSQNATSDLVMATTRQFTVRGGVHFRSIRRLSVYSHRLLPHSTTLFTPSPFRAPLLLRHLPGGPAVRGPRRMQRDDRRVRLRAQVDRPRLHYRHLPWDPPLRVWWCVAV
ncbi:hypothetical protein PAPYR_3541 [Paratrimastix pyriformis]|uniref:EGF-like domain-containing protein n=1 Tax=Paratrimastix pyriformis TaxID=342808 RepID=A0ABQ8ULU9_9EUKA|nr:hypothetical protein PAPYR_3541 [Paratrimastix pyriformis]